MLCLQLFYTNAVPYGHKPFSFSFNLMNHFIQRILFEDLKFSEAVASEDLELGLFCLTKLKIKGQIYIKCSQQNIYYCGYCFPISLADNISLLMYRLASRIGSRRLMGAPNAIHICQKQRDLVDEQHYGALIK